MTHFMNLSLSAYRAFMQGGKRVEMRLLDEKRRAVKVGDSIVFDCGGLRFKVEVKGVKAFENFSALYAAYPARILGYEDGGRADPADMNAYYPPSRQKECGVVAIETGAPQEVL